MPQENGNDLHHSDRHCTLHYYSQIKKSKGIQKHHNLYTSAGTAACILDVVDGIEHLLLVVELVQAELGDGITVELLHPHSDLVLADVPILGQALDQRHQPPEVGLPQAPGRVEHEDNVRLLADCV